MKTAEEWALPTAHKTGCDCLTCKNTRAIQLDAWKQGMTDAYKVIDARIEEGYFEIQQAILTERDNKTSL